MFLVNPLIGFSARRAVVASSFSFSFLNSYSDTTSTTALTKSIDAGAADATKELVFAIGCRASGASTNFIASVSYDGNACTRDVGTTTNGQNSHGLWRVPYAGSGSHNLVITLNGANAFNRWVIGAYSLLNRTSPNAAAHDTGGPSVGNDDRSVTLDVQAGGCILAVMCLATVTAGTWVNATEDFSVTPGTVHRVQGASHSSVSGETNRTITVQTGAGDGGGLSAASYH